MENSNGNTCHKHNHFSSVTRSSHMLQTKNRPTPTDAHVSAPRSRPTLLNRSKSKSCKVEESTLTSRTDRQKLPRESKDDSNKLLQRSRSNMDVARQSRSACSSPSAWALSPGRSLHPLPPMSQLNLAPKSPIISAKSKRDSCSTKGGSGVSGILKYFSKKIKKVSLLQEEDYYQFRIMHNTLLQWRFVNARAEVSMTAVNRVAQKKLFNSWLRTSVMRNVIAENRIQLQNLIRQIKLYYILSSEDCLLKEWGRLESKYCEAVGRLARKLSAIAVCLPVDQGAKADVTSFPDSMSMATKVVQDIEPMMTNIQAQVGRICYMLTELSVIVKEQNDYVSKLENSLAMVAPLVAQETSLRLHCIQLDEESRRVNFINSHP